MYFDINTSYKKHMILYHAISTYQLLEMILYRLKHSEKEESILLITDTLYDKFPDLEKYKNFFEEVWVYAIDIKFPPKKTFVSVINNYFDEYFLNKNIKIKEFSEINVACAHYYFGHYLVSNNIPFVFFEDAAGIISRPDILINIEKDRRPFKCKKNIELGLYDGRAKCVQKVVCNAKAQNSEVLSDYNYIHFNVIQELLQTNKENQEKILKMFVKTDKLSIDSEVVILLTQHFANLKILSFMDQIKIYQLFVDYFLDNHKILIKAHPDDVMYYKYILDNVDIIQEKFPSEFLPLLINSNVKAISTISSTAIKNYYDCDYDLFELNTDFEKTFDSVHSYYVALNLLKKIGCSCFKTIGCDDNLLNALIQRNSECSDMKIDSVGEACLIDDYFDLYFSENEFQYNDFFLEYVEDKLAMDDRKVFIFLNSNSYYTFFKESQEVFNYIIPVVITLENEELCEKTIFVYTRDIDKLNQVRSFAMNKDLKNSKEHLKVEPLSDLEKRVYEGKIKSLEERLRYYIEQSKKTKLGE